MSINRSTSSSTSWKSWSERRSLTTAAPEAKMPPPSILSRYATPLSRNSWTEAREGRCHITMCDLYPQCARAVVPTQHAATYQQPRFLSFHMRYRSHGKWVIARFVHAQGLTLPTTPEEYSRPDLAPHGCWRRISLSGAREENYPPAKREGDLTDQSARSSCRTSTWRGTIRPRTSRLDHNLVRRYEDNFYIIMIHRMKVLNYC